MDSSDLTEAAPHLELCQADKSAVATVSKTKELKRRQFWRPYKRLSFQRASTHLSREPS